MTKPCRWAGQKPGDAHKSFGVGWAEVDDWLAERMLNKGYAAAEEPKEEPSEGNQGAAGDDAGAGGKSGDAGSDDGKGEGDGTGTGDKKGAAGKK